jgi:hypothetical protein
MNIRLPLTGLVVSAALCVISACARAPRIFVVNQGPLGVGTIGEYTISGTTINAALVTGLDIPTDIGYLEGIYLSRNRVPV